MTNTLRGKTAIVTGASSGVGRAAAKLLAAEGVRVVGVARGAERLATLRAEVAGVEVAAGDAADSALAERLLREHRPDIVILAAGVQPKMAPLDEQTWESFSEPWSSDTRATFHFVKGALSLPLAPGSTTVIVSSGAAIHGSHLSGGYAGAKRMQWLLAGYGQQLSDKRKLGLRFVALLPKQLIAGTSIGATAASAYASWAGVSEAEFLRRFEVPLDADKVARSIVDCVRGDIDPAFTALGVTGTGVEKLG